MRVTSLIGLGVILLVISGIVYVTVFRWDDVDDLVHYARYVPAKTPTEAYEKFHAAAVARDFKLAAYYCGGDYAEQMRKAAKGGTRLGKAVDNLRSVLELENIKTDNVAFILGQLEPFPTETHLAYLDYKDGSDRAVGTITEDTSRLKPEAAKAVGTWNVDRSMFRSLTQGFPASSAYEFRLEGQGKNASWKIIFPVTADLRVAADKLRDHGPNFARALDKVKSEVKNDPTTKSDVERRIREEMEEASR
jgi:hypothetical protein